MSFSEQPTLDLDTTRDRLAENEQLLQELARFVVDDAPTYLETLEEAIERRDALLAAQAAHSLKCLASIFEANPTVALATEIEWAARKGRLVQVDDLPSELKYQFKAVSEILKQDVLSTN